MRVLCLIIGLLGFGLLAESASADTACTVGNFAAIAGTTCDIGSLQFSFTAVSSYGGGWTASDLYFEPVANGFTLSFLGGAQSLTANNANPFENVTFDELGLTFDVMAPQGTYFNGVNVASAGTRTASGLYSFASGGIIGQSTVGGAGDYVLCANYNCPTITANYPAQPPFSSTASVDAIVFDLWAGSGTASWDGSPTTYTISLDNNVSEPNVGVLLCLGFLMLRAGGLVQRKQL